MSGIVGMVFYNQGSGKAFIFQTNSGGGDTFDPELLRYVGTDVMHWDLGDGTTFDGNSVTKNYPDGTTKTIKVTIDNDNFVDVRQVDFREDKIVGVLDLTLFTRLGGWVIASIAPALTEVIFPELEAGYSPTLLFFAQCNIQGVVDLRPLGVNNSTWTSAAAIDFSSNPITNVLFPTINNQLGALTFNNCNLTGTLDLSMMQWGSGNCYFHNNPNLTEVIFPVNCNNRSSRMYFMSCNITGIVDLSGFNKGGASQIRFSNNPNMTGIIFSATPFTDSIRHLYLDGCNINGVLDLTSIQNLGDIMFFQNNPNMTAINFSATWIGSMATALFNCTANIGLTTLDLSVFTTCFTNVTLTGCSNLISIAFAPANSTTRVPSSHGFFNCSSLQSLDLRCYTNLGGSIDIRGCTSLTSFLYNATSQPVLIEARECGLATLDLSGFSGLNTLYCGNTAVLTTIILPNSNATFNNILTLISPNLVYDGVDFDLKKLPNCSDVNDFTLDMRNCGLSQAEVDAVLADMDTISVGGFTGRTIFVGGNTVPSAAGITSKNNLIAKGFNVITD